MGTLLENVGGSHPELLATPVIDASTATDAGLDVPSVWVRLDT